METSLDTYAQFSQWLNMNVFMFNEYELMVPYCVPELGE